MTAVRVYGRTVKTRWAASSGPVAGYVVIRNGVRIGRTTKLQFYNWVPRDVRRVTYVVRAIDRWGNLSPRSSSVTVYVR